MPDWAEDLLTLLAMPLGIGVAVAVGGLVALLLRRYRLGTALMAVAALWLWLWSAPAFASRIASSLVQVPPLATLQTLPQADAIVVLLNDVGANTSRRDWPLAGTTADSLWHGARLLAANKAPVVIVSGSSYDPKPGQLTSGEVMREFLTAMGVPARAILTEDRSTNTRENAVFSARLAVRHDIQTVLLVTRLWHMPRAASAFRKAGLTVAPAAPSGRGRMPKFTKAKNLVPNAKSLRGATLYVHEWLGTLVYRWRGWI